MNWVKENIKKAAIIYGIVIGVAGFIIGVYVTQLSLGNDIEFIKDEIQSIRDNDLWNIRQRLNRAK